ncbi:pyridine nucleotide-disulfide oxidoreductase [Candidatus Magnetomorum sp. HK-1]|nr:pyridine nucleotide-disulfide oxidoreductase [Candidatus Magnetomorum sp. HK-1]
MKKKHIRLILILLISSMIISFFYFDLGQHFTLSNLKDKHTGLTNYYENNKQISIVVYMIAYILMAALSLPGAAVMSLAGASVFGFWLGLILVSFASTIGATLAFLVARFILKDYIQDKFSDKLKKINKGIEKDGIFYLLTLRLIPVFPFFVINLVMGLTSIRVLTFYIVSQLGMLPGTAIFVNAGTQIGQLSSTKGILSPSLILSFILLGIFPWIAKFLVSYVKNRKVLSKYSKPKKFDYNLIVIGAGSAGLVSSLIAATVKSKVCLIEKHKMGGDCLNTGCIPSKAIIKSAKILSYSKNAEKYGIKSLTPEFNFKDIMNRVHKIIKKIEPHDSVERYTELGVECISGSATLISPYEVSVNQKTISAKNIILATGASPFIPPIKGIEHIEYLTSENIWDIQELPKNLIVLGGGPIGCELSQAFARLGSNVTIVEMAGNIMGREDHDVTDIITKKFEEENITVLTKHMAKEIKTDKQDKILIASFKGKDVEMKFDQILVAVGRKANTTGFGLEKLGVELNPNGSLKVNEYLQTSIPTIYCAGDVAGPYQFTHTAAHQAWFASVNSLFGHLKRFKVDYSVIPWATYTDPEVARVGLSETEAKHLQIDYELTKYAIDDLDRAIADSVDYGFVKVITKKGSDKILGVTIVGDNAGNIISEYVLAMKNKIGLNKILSTIHIYPTLSEANKFAAIEWKKARKPEKLLNYLKKYHSWLL